MNTKKNSIPVSNHAVFAAALVFLSVSTAHGAGCELTVARLQYGGGGDWYADPSSLPNLIEYVRKHTAAPVCDTTATVEIMSDRLFTYPFLYMTGHGNVHFTDREKLRLRKYLISGGFLWADDNYGMDKSFRRELASLFPENPLTPVPSDHPVYKSTYALPGLPKIHEHDGEPAQGFGVFFENRMLVYYTYSSDIGDGMEDMQVHNDSPRLHELALQMGTNIIIWFFEQ
ncbi:MAG: DUF4159 domain-containing protein [Chitinivibrionales bacterium]|nr:DUF4159 domain-containing protein [Chitinivibrionales bacterium]